MADPVVDEVVEVDPRIGQPIPQALRGAGAESVQFEGEDTVYAVENDVIVATAEQRSADIEAKREQDAKDALGTNS